MNKIFINNKWLFHIAIIAIPFLSYIDNNFYNLDFVILRSLLVFFVLILTSIFVLSKLLEFFYRKISHKLYALILSFGFFLLFHLYAFLKDLIFVITPIRIQDPAAGYHNEVAFVLTLLIFVIFFITFYIKENKFINNLILIYLSLNFLLYFTIILIGFTTVFTKHLSLNENLYLVKKDEKIKPNLNKTNMYFILVDNAISIKKFDEFYNTEYSSSYLPKFNNLGFLYVHDTNAVYDYSAHNLASLFYMYYQINLKNYKKYLIYNTYPNILKKGAENLPLIKNLKILGYKFNWIGTSHYNCELYNPNFCIESGDNTSINSFISPYVTNTFLERSPLKPAYYKIKRLLSKVYDDDLTTEKLESNYEFKGNDAINIFLKKIKNIDKSKNNFFFVHHYMPHAPYIFEPDCSINKNNNENLNIGYMKNYKCMLNRLMAFLEYINKYDPQANVIVTSDGSPMFYNKVTENKVKMFVSKFNSFTLIKINKECKKYLNKKLNIPNEIRLLLACSNDLKIELLEPKNYHLNETKSLTSFGGRPELMEINSKSNENFRSTMEQIRSEEVNPNTDKIEWILIEGQWKGIPNEFFFQQQ